MADCGIVYRTVGLLKLCDGLWIECVLWDCVMDVRLCAGLWARMWTVGLCARMKGPCHGPPSAPAVSRGQPIKCHPIVSQWYWGSAQRPGKVLSVHCMLHYTYTTRELLNRRIMCRFPEQQVDVVGAAPEVDNHRMLMAQYKQLLIIM